MSEIVEFIQVSSAGSKSGALSCRRRWASWSWVRICFVILRSSATCSVAEEDCFGACKDSVGDGDASAGWDIDDSD